MKLSVKVQEPHQHQQNNHQKPPQNHPLLLRAKIPITIFNLPFFSAFSTTTHHPSDLSLSLATNFSSGPTLKLSYSSATTTAAPPITLTLKSGAGLFGSPNNSPLIISANFSFSPNNSNPNPTFSLLFKPQLGSFSLRKSTSSNPIPGPRTNGDANPFGFVPLERPVGFKDFSVADYCGKDSIFKGISVMARTEMPVTKRVSVNCRWGVNFPQDLGNGLPFMSVNKIGIERVAEEVKDVKEKKNDSGGDVDLLKGMCVWMRKELDVLQRENKEMKLRLEEMKMGHLVGVGSGGREREVVGRKAVPAAEKSGGFEQWMSKKNGNEENGKKETKKNGNQPSSVESELQRAIKAASSS